MKALYLRSALKKSSTSGIFKKWECEIMAFKKKSDKKKSDIVEEEEEQTEEEDEEEDF